LQERPIATLKNTPNNQQVCEGSSLALFADTLYTDAVAWVHNVRGVVSDSLSYVTAATMADVGRYYMIAHNDCGNDTTDVVDVRVIQSAHIAV